MSGRAPSYGSDAPDTSKYALPNRMPKWAKWLLGLDIVALVALIATVTMLIVILIKGDAMGATVTSATNSIEDLSALESVMPMILNLLTSIYNVTLQQQQQSSQGVDSQSLDFSSGYDDPVPPIHYVNIMDNTVRMAYRFRGIGCASQESDVVFCVHSLASSSVECISEMLRYSHDSTKCTVAPDLIGHGSSDATNEALGASVGNQAMYLFQFLYQLGVIANSSRRVIGVGSGFGGSVVVQLTQDYPGIADELILVNPIPYMVKPGDPNATMSATTGASSLDAIMQLATLSLYNVTAYTSLVASSLGRGSSCSPDALEPVVAAYRQVALACDPAAVAQGLVSLASLDHRNAFDNMITPVMLITGARTGLETFSSLNYALLAEEARDHVGLLATMHVIGSAAAAVHITHGGLFHQLSNQFLSGLDTDCDLAPIAWSQIV